MSCKKSQFRKKAGKAPTWLLSLSYCLEVVWGAFRKITVIVTEREGGSKGSLRHHHRFQNRIRVVAVRAAPGRDANSALTTNFIFQVNTMNFPTHDEGRDSIEYGYSKPIDVKTFIWVKRRMRLLEVQGRLANRIALFEEFYLPSLYNRD